MQNACQIRHDSAKHLSMKLLYTGLGQINLSRLKNSGITSQGPVPSSKEPFLWIFFWNLKERGAVSTIWLGRSLKSLQNPLRKASIYYTLDLLASRPTYLRNLIVI